MIEFGGMSGPCHFVSFNTFNLIFLIVARIFDLQVFLLVMEWTVVLATAELLYQEKLTARHINLALLILEVL